MKISRTYSPRSQNQEGKVSSKIKICGQCSSGKYFRSRRKSWLQHQYAVIRRNSHLGPGFVDWGPVLEECLLTFLSLMSSKSERRKTVMPEDTWYFLYSSSQNNLPVKLNVSFYISWEAFYFSTLQNKQQQQKKISNWLKWHKWFNCSQKRPKASGMVWSGLQLTLSTILRTLPNAMCQFCSPSDFPLAQDATSNNRDHMALFFTTVEKNLASHDHQQKSWALSWLGHSEANLWGQKTGVLIGFRMGYLYQSPVGLRLGASPDDMAATC